MEGQLTDAVNGILERLSDEERFIIEQRVLANVPLSLKELGERLGMSRDQARLLEIATRDKMRELLVGLIEPGQPVSSRAKFTTVFKPGNA